MHILGGVLLLNGKFSCAKCTYFCEQDIFWVANIMLCAEIKSISLTPFFYMNNCVIIIYKYRFNERIGGLYAETETKVE